MLEVTQPRMQFLSCHEKQAYDIWKGRCFQQEKTAVKSSLGG